MFQQPGRTRRLHLPAWQAAVWICLACALPATADEFSAFAGVWPYHLRGGIVDQGQGTNIVLDSNSGVQVNTQVQVLLHYGFTRHHQSCWIPELYAGYIHLGAAGQVPATETSTFGGVPIIKGNTLIFPNINLSDYELAADWCWPMIHSSQVRVESGLKLKYLAGHGNVRTDTTVSLLGVVPVQHLVSEAPFSVDQPVPLVELRGRADPWPWLRLEANGGYIFYAGNHAGELRAAANVFIWGPVFLTAAYQEQIYKVKANPYILHARLSGPSLGITITTP